MKAFLVEDQPPIREELKTLIGLHCPDIELVGTAGSVVEAARLIRTLGPELLLLDIELPDGTAFDLLDIVGHPMRVIFITGSDAYAIRAFRYAAIDYLLKPVSVRELQEHKSLETIQIHTQAIMA